MDLVKIAHVLRKYKVNTCYLFGSQATGNASPGSDVDLAVLFSHYNSAKHNLALLAKMEDELRQALGQQEVDLVFLQKENLRFKFEVIRTSKVIYCQDDEARTNFEDIVVRDYLDFAPVLDIFYKEMADSIQGGEFFA